jgi:hypothetical protein
MAMKDGALTLMCRTYTGFKPGAVQTLPRYASTRPRDGYYRQDDDPSTNATHERKVRLSSNG